MAEYAYCWSLWRKGELGEKQKNKEIMARFFPKLLKTTNPEIQ